MRKLYYAILFFVVFYSKPFEVVSQYRLWSGFQSESIDPSVYTTIQNLWYANERPSYICMPYYKILKEPVIPIRDNEGKNAFNIMEADIYHQLPIAIGRNHGKHFYQTSRITFDYGFNKRIVTGESSPLVPSNNIFGISVFKSIWNNYTNHPSIRANRRHYSFDNFAELERGLRELSFSATLNHYSNGQPPGVFLEDSINGELARRHDYREGDFSTNYLKIGLTYSDLKDSRNLLSANFSLQFDFAIGETLGFTEEQKKSYGQMRLKSFVQHRWLFLRKYRPSIISDACNPEDRPCRRVNYFSELIVRWEGEHIVGDLSDYNNGASEKFRFGQHLYLQFTRPNWRALGLVIHLYQGRDYSNIRYDMPVFAAMAGLSVNFNKYYPTLSTEKKGLNTPCDESDLGLMRRRLASRWRN